MLTRTVIYKEKNIEKFRIYHITLACGLLILYPAENRSYKFLEQDPNSWMPGSYSLTVNKRKVYQNKYEIYIAEDLKKKTINRAQVHLETY